MKKNLKIVSATAAALLAVAPVAASTISTVNADQVIQSGHEVGPVQPIPDKADVNITPNISLNTSVKKLNIAAALNVSFTATVDGTTATSTLTPQGDKNASSISMWYYTTENGKEVRHDVKTVQDVDQVQAGTLYKVQLDNVTLNFGDKNANKDITLVLPNENGNHFGNDGNQTTLKTKTDANGVAHIDRVILGVTAKDFANPAVVNWRSNATGATVTSGDVTIYAGSDAGKMNISEIRHAIDEKYFAENSIRPQSSTINYSSDADIAKQLKDQGIDVSADGWFVAPKTFTVNYKATANNNDASSTLAVTVNVPDGKDTTASTEPSVSKKVMYKSVVYNSKGEKTNDTIAGYDYANLVTENGSLKHYTINGGDYYKIAGKDGYVRARNVTGSKMTLKKNAYAYKSNGKRANKTTYKKGTTVTVYGGEYKAIKGYKGQAVRIGTNKYIKSVNVNYKLAD